MHSFMFFVIIFFPMGITVWAQHRSMGNPRKHESTPRWWQDFDIFAWVIVLYLRTTNRLAHRLMPYSEKININHEYLNVAKKKNLKANVCHEKVDNDRDKIFFLHILKMIIFNLQLVLQSVPMVNFVNELWKWFKITKINWLNNFEKCVVPYNLVLANLYALNIKLCVIN